MADIRISAAICTYNRASLLGEAIEYLLKQDFPHDQYEIIVIDNASTDNTAAVIKSFTSRNETPPIRYFHETQPGLSHARNRGIAEAHGEFIAFIDDDGLADPHWLSELVTIFDTNQAAAVGGRVDLLFRERLPYWLTRRFHGWLSMYTPNQTDPYAITARPWPVGCNIAFTRQILQDFGGFNPELGRKGKLLLTGEETALFQRLAQAKKTIVIAPDAKVQHIVASDRMSKSYFIKIQRGIISSRLKYYQQVSPGKRIILLMRASVETIVNGIRLVLSFLTVRYWFLAYLYFYRSLLKLKALLKIML